MWSFKRNIMKTMSEGVYLGASFTVTGEMGAGTDVHDKTVTVIGNPYEVINWSSTVSVSGTTIIGLSISDELSNFYTISKTASSSGSITLSASGTRTLYFEITCHPTPGNVVCNFIFKEATNTTNLSPNGSFNLNAIST